MKFSFPRFWILKAWEGRQCLKAEKLKEVNSFQNARWEDSQILVAMSHGWTPEWQDGSFKRVKAIGALLQLLGEALGFLTGLWKEGMDGLPYDPASIRPGTLPRDHNCQVVPKLWFP